MGAADGDLVAQLVCEAFTGLVTVLCRSEQRPQKKHESVRVLVCSHDLLDQFDGIATDLVHRVGPVEREALDTVDTQLNHLLSDMVQVEGVVEEADEGSNRAGCVVVLGLAQQQSAAALDVTQIDIVAQAGSDDFGSAVYGQYNLWPGVVPGGVGTNANVAARYCDQMPWLCSTCLSA